MNPAIRLRVLEEWRGLPQRIPVPDRALPVGHYIEATMRNMGLGDRITESEIREAWRGLVGDFLATHSQPSRLRAGVLYVNVIQSTVHYELDRVWRPQVVTKLQQRFGKKIIRDVRFVIGG